MIPSDRLLTPVARAFYGTFTTLRPAQEAAIVPLVEGENVVLSSGTGSGKTEAVLAPLISRYYEAARDGDSVTFLYIVPTKALANDLERRLVGPLDHLHLRVGIRHGDRDDVKSGPHPHLLITTPESLEVLLFRQDHCLDTVKCIVIDEVHLLYNTQRGLQLSILLRRLRDRLGREVQWAALSATVAQLGAVKEFLVGSVEGATLLSFPAHRMIDAQVRRVSSDLDLLERVRHLIALPTKILLFANTRHECERLAQILHSDDYLRQCTFTHYSSLAPQVRQDHEERFASLRTAICITTSTLELGIDIGDIDLVVLWDIPTSIESFLQRIGRGNRRSSKTNVLGLIPNYVATPLLTALQFVSIIDAARNGTLPLRSPYNLYGSIVQQILAIIGSANGRFTGVNEICQVVRQKDNIDRTDVESVLLTLADRQYLQRHVYENRYGAGDKLYDLIDKRMIYGNFPLGSDMVVVWYKSKELGTVPRVNLLRAQVDHVVRFTGRAWRIIELSSHGILVEPANYGGSSDFIYGGGAPHLDRYIIDSAWRLWGRGGEPFAVLGDTLQKDLLALRHRVIGDTQPHIIPFVHTQQGVRYFTFAGTLINQAIALVTNQSMYSSDDITLTVGGTIQWNNVPTDASLYESIYHSLLSHMDDQSFFQTLLPIHLQKRELFEEWIHDETVPSILSRLASSTTRQIDPTVAYALHSV